MEKILSRITLIRKDHRNLWNMLLVRFSRYFKDVQYIKLKYRLWFGKEINLDNPQTFNEKLNWLKLNNRNPMYCMMADKYWVKKWVARQVGEEYVVPCYGHWKRLEDIDFDKLPDRCYLKSNQDSGGGMLLDKNKGVDMFFLKQRFGKKAIARKNWYWSSREYAYKNIEPCILAEKYLDEGTGHELHDYKFWCFNGKPTYMYVTNKGTIIKENFYDMDFNPVMIDHGFERTVPEYEKPANFEKMKEIAEKLSVGIPFVRIDFFNVDNHLYFGECTFYDWAGFQPFGDEKWDIELGKLIRLPKDQ